MARSFLTRGLAALCLLLGGACSDCTDAEDCVHGYCESRQCICDDGYLGNTCDIQAKPKAIVIHRISVYGLPAQIMSSSWDEDTTSSISHYGDVMLQLRKGNESELFFTSSERFMNTSATAFTFERDMNIRLEDEFPKLAFTIADLDEPAPEPIHAISVTGYYQPSGGFPDSVTVIDNAGVMLSMHLKYEH